MHVCRPVFSDHIANGQLVERATELMEWLQEGKLTVNIAGILPFEDAARAHEILENSSSLGKLLLKFRDQTDELNESVNFL